MNAHQKCYYVLKIKKYNQAKHSMGKSFLFSTGVFAKRKR